MPDAGVLATMLLVLGLFLLGLEFFIPSFGMILVIAVLSLIVSFWSACKAWWIPIAKAHEPGLGHMSFS